MYDNNTSYASGYSRYRAIKSNFGGNSEEDYYEMAGWSPGDNAFNTIGGGGGGLGFGNHWTNQYSSRDRDYFMLSTAGYDQKYGRHAWEKTQGRNESKWEFVTHDIKIKLRFFRPNFYGRREHTTKMITLKFWKSVDVDQNERNGGVIYVDFTQTPTEFERDLYIGKLKDRLIDEGFNSSTRIEEYSAFSHFYSYLRGDTYATVTFSAPTKRESEKGTLGIAGYYSNKAVILMYAHLSIDEYVATTVHELGHALFGFKHLINMLNIMYEKLIDPSAGFNEKQKEIIRESEWGK